MVAFLARRRRRQNEPPRVAEGVWTAYYAGPGRTGFFVVSAPDSLAAEAAAVRRLTIDERVLRVVPGDLRLP